MRTIVFDGLEFEHRVSDRRTTLEIVVDRDGSLALATPPSVSKEDLVAFVEYHLVGVYTKLEEKVARVQPRARGSSTWSAATASS
ncbi:MAG: hypothetical protein ACOC8C_00540 [Chloroflexota bacterium]